MTMFGIFVHNISDYLQTATDWFDRTRKSKNVLGIIVRNLKEIPDQPRLTRLHWRVNYGNSGVFSVYIRKRNSTNSLMATISQLPIDLQHISPRFL